MGVPYDFGEIEARWRQRWDDARLGTVDVRGQVFYNLVEFPYPSAEGLHVGHIFKYAGVDAYGRYHRMRGDKVFQPIGFDAFGIHTENYALKAGVHPGVLTARTTAAFRRQLAHAGIAWDWSRVIDTSQPRYYRWTQWILTRLHAAGLMYQADAPAVWCPSCLTVLAREQTEGPAGEAVCERCGTRVVERQMRQWFLRTTAYADRLLAGLESLDWPEHAKALQRAWIGRSEGCEIDFGDLTVFTTRPETLPAATFLAVPVGHPAADTTRPHPLTGDPIAVVEADYVVDTYGTGIVMGVPAHDERDRRLALRLGLPVSDAPLLDRGASMPGRPAVRYRMRDWLISRQRYWGPPIPVVHCSHADPWPFPSRTSPCSSP